MGKEQNTFPGYSCYTFFVLNIFFVIVYFKSSKIFPKNSKIFWFSLTPLIFLRATVC